MVYVWQLEELERQMSTQILAANLARVLGAEVDVPDWWSLREQFDADLGAEPPRIDPDMAVLRRAVGLGR